MTHAVFVNFDKGIDLLVNAALESRNKPFLVSANGHEPNLGLFINILVKELGELGLRGGVADAEQPPVDAASPSKSYWVVKCATSPPNLNEYFYRHFGKLPDKYVCVKDDNSVTIQDN